MHFNVDLESPADCDCVSMQVFLLGPNFTLRARGRTWEIAHIVLHGRDGLRGNINGRVVHALPCCMEVLEQRIVTEAFRAKLK